MKTCVFLEGYFKGVGSKMQKVLLKRFTQDDWKLLKSDEII
jgi:hypothetical protein